MRVLLSVLACFLFFSSVLSQGERTKLRVVHTIPGSPNVDLYANDLATSVKNLAFTQASDYILLPAGTWELKITLTGDKNQVIKAANYELVSHVTYSLLVLRDGTNGLPTYNLKIDDNTPPKEKFAHVRFIHSTPVSPTFPITVEVNSVPVFLGYNYGQASAYQVFPAGLYNVTYRIDTPVRTVLTTVRDVRFNSRTVYTLYALGLENVIATVSVDAVPRVIDPCENCPCANLDAFSSSAEVSFTFEGMVPQQTACCAGKK